MQKNEPLKSIITICLTLTVLINPLILSKITQEFIMIKIKDNLNSIFSSIKEFKRSRKSKKHSLVKQFKKELTYGTSECILETFEQGIKEVYGDSNDVWNFRALLMLKNILEILVWYRDNDGKSITISALKFYLDVNKFSNLYNNSKLPKSISSIAKEYINSFPGYDESMQKQSDKTTDYFDYVKMIVLNVIESRFV